MLVTMDTKLKQVFPHLTMREGPHVGIEMEYEGVHDPFVLDWGWSRWRCDEDPSLRDGGVEFISLPTKENMIDAALKQLDEIITEFSPEVNVRCGMHVHINMTDRTLGDIFKIGTLYGLVEPYIFAKYAPGREDNHFCVPLWYNTAMQGYMYRDNMKLRKGMVIKGGVSVEDEPDPSHIAIPSNPSTAGLEVTMTNFVKLQMAQVLEQAPADVFEFLHDSKYSSWNVRALSKFGTLEYRLPQSTVETEEVNDFVRFLLRLHAYAYSVKDPVEILTAWENIGYEGLLNNLGLPFTPCENEDMEDALDAALLVAGHEPITHTDLEWEIA